MVYKWKLTIPQLSGRTKRRAYVYVPECYYYEPERRFPVMYMFDGHNVFFDSDATYGKSWGMAKYMAQTATPMIIVAVECNHEGTKRLEEYSPISHEDSSLGKIRGRGRTYMNWLVYNLKPEVDRRLRTLPERENTIICGSSMGGLMALYAATVYNNVFQRAACLSPSLWVAPEKILHLISNAHIQKDTCIYMDYGAVEIFNHDASSQALSETVQLLLRKQVNLTFRIVPNGTHSEASWEEQIPIFMDCLGIKGER
ncbi:MAG: alpha/beta hydrolase [Oscillospiraceae bacterium]|nr:alpha/beta hydrolase [Oscillospiraceae bacterium]